VLSQLRLKTKLLIEADINPETGVPHGNDQGRLLIPTQVSTTGIGKNIVDVVGKGRKLKNLMKRQVRVT
jgi:hypothetical protein